MKCWINKDKKQIDLPLHLAIKAHLPKLYGIPSRVLQTMNRNFHQLNEEMITFLKDFLYKRKP